MPERKIDPKFNIHSSYRTLNILNPYRYSGGTSYDPDFQAKIDFAVTNNISLPSDTYLAIENQQIIDYKATGGWDKDDAVYVFSGEADAHIDFRLIDVKRRVKAQAFGTLYWTSDGVRSDGSTGYINPKFNPTVDGVNYALNDACYMWNLKTDMRTMRMFGLYSGNTSDYVLISEDHHSIHAVNSGNSSIERVGLCQVSRIDDTTVVAQGIQQITTSSNSGTLPNNEIYLFARNRADVNSVDFFGDTKIDFMTIGASKTGEFTDMHNALNP